MCSSLPGLVRRFSICLSMLVQRLDGSHSLEVDLDFSTGLFVVLVLSVPGEALFKRLQPQWFCVWATVSVRDNHAII